MASSSEVNVHMEEVVVVTTPDSTGQTSSTDEEKNILVATDLERSGWESCRRSSFAPIMHLSDWPHHCVFSYSEHIVEQTLDSEAESSSTTSLPKDTVLGMTFGSYIKHTLGQQ